MSDFRELSSTVWASPQVSLADIDAAAADGFALLVNNRPDGESADQLSAQDAENAARHAGLDYLAIPITHAGFSEQQVEAMVEALQGAKGPVLAYCRSGTRSTLLWALAQARLGEDLDRIAQAAARAGYDVSPVWPAMEMLADRAGS